MENFVYSTESVQNNFAKIVYEKAKEIFGDDIANPEQEPMRFAYQMRVVEFSIKRENFK
jgi:hypothetical protein